jgi:hypothetical protein
MATRSLPWLPSRIALLALLGGMALPVSAMTPAEWLQAQPQPRFREGHTLPRLTRYGWIDNVPTDARIELCRNWGYAVQLGPYLSWKVVDDLLKQAEKPTDGDPKLLALCMADPKKYPLCIVLSRDLPTTPDPWTRDAKGALVDGKELWSPEAPRATLEGAAELRAGPLRKLHEKVPVALVLNGGEYALGVLGFARKQWEQDPRIAKGRGDKDWFAYVSEKKGLMETVIADAVRKAAPDRSLYIYYTAGGGTHRNRTGSWSDWAYGYEWMRTASDLPSNEYYYKHFNDGWTGANDMLTQALNARGHELKFNAPLSYDWLCAGWVEEKPAPAYKPGENPAALVDITAGKLGDIARYTGFLKCLYTAGTVGANAGYYAFPAGGFGALFPAEKPPHWLRQAAALAHVHAFFSHQEPFVRGSDLLPGPAMHRWSKDQPAYEFPAGDKDVRILARKRKGAPQWLIVTWAADGDARDAGVEIPDLGKVTLRARPEGAVYRATLENGKPALQLLDEDGLCPTSRR